MDAHNIPESHRRRLGRGLNALIGAGSYGDGSAPESQDQSQIHVELIERNPFQPRADFDQQTLNELVDSIRLHGVLQPLLVRPTGETYQLVAGERRLIAAKKAGLESVPCRVMELTDQQVCEVSLEENLKRQDLNVLEKAAAFQDYLDRFRCFPEELAQRLSVDRSTVVNMVRLLELPEAVKAQVRTGKVSASHAKALLPLPETVQVTLVETIVAEGWSVRRTEDAVRALQETTETIPFPGPEAATESKPKGSPVTNHIRSLQDQLQDWLGAKVEIKLKGKEAGRIVIEFASNDEFERLLGLLRKAA
jgi:ParB family chromosome partitioning protein